VADLVDQPPGTDVVEIGPGPGGLTRELLARGRRVLAVEIDPACCRRLREELGGVDGFRLVEADARRVDWAVALAAAGWRLPAAVLGNFPYNVGTHLVRSLLPRRDLFALVGGILQDEVAGRMTAAPGAGNYGYLSVYCRYFAEPAAGALVRPGAFHPPPRVNSRLFRLALRPGPLLLPELEPGFLALAAAAFRAPRKTLLNNLPAGAVRDAARRWLAAAGLAADVRPGAVGLDAFLSLARELAAEKALAGILPSGYNGGDPITA
jgi:16S rRNA (adenine1518-N6/adenine1519-N6)-dimethyltransferase